MRKAILCFIVVAVIFSAVLTSCDNEDKDNASIELMPTKRYETVPYGSGDSNGQTHKLIHCNYDDEHNYYFYLLGHINSVPIASTAAVYYNGVTNQEISFQRSDVNETSVSKSIEEAVERGFTDSRTNTWGNEVKIGIAGNIKDIVKISGSYSHSWGGSISISEMNSRSISNTFETSSKTVSTLTSGHKMNIGEKGEPAGMYRYALFSTSDVYYVLITDRAKTKFVDKYTVLCARNVQNLIQDYDPEYLGSFGKTASGTLLEIPEIDVSQLPDIEECEHEWAEQIILVPSCTTDGEKIKYCIHDLTHMKRESIPARGHQWITTITKQPTETEDGEEIISCANCSEIQGIYPIRLYYTLGESDSKTIKGSGGSVYSWTHNAGFNIERLKEHGYTTITVSLNYKSRANGVLIGAESKVQVFGGHGANNETWFSIAQGHTVGSTAWRTASNSKTLAIDKFNNLFTIYFHSTHVADHTIGQRTVTVTAKK